MRRRFARRFGLGVCSAVRALSLGALLIVAGCGTQEAPATDLAPRQIQEPDDAQGGAPPPAEPGQSSLAAKGEAAKQELERLMKFEEANGSEIYQRYCKVCHGDSGEGDGFNAFNLDPKPRSLVDQSAREQLTDEALTRSISLGGAGRNKSPLMPRWGRTLSGRQIRYVIAYIRLLQRRVPSAEAGPETPQY